MARKKADTKVVEKPTEGELDTIVTKNEEIGNDTVQLTEQSRSETDSTQVKGSFVIGAEGQGSYALADIPHLIPLKDVHKASQEAQEGVLEGLAIGEPTLEPEQGLDETVGTPDEVDGDEEEDLEVAVIDVALTPIEVTGVDYLDCVSQVLYAGSLGAKINPNYRPQLKRVPYRVDLLIPVDQVEVFHNKSSMQEYDSSVQYNEASLSSVDVGRFVEQLLEAGEDGAILTPNKATNNFVSFAAALSSLSPFKDTATVQSAAVKRYYTYKELHAFRMEGLKVIASWYKIRKQPKWLLVQQILKAQRERQEHEERAKLGS